MRLLARVTIVAFLFGVLLLWGYASQPSALVAGIVGGLVGLVVCKLWQLTSPF